MKIAGVYAFKDGVKQIAHHYPGLLTEVNAVIQAVDADTHKTKVSKEKTMSGRILYSPSSLNKAFKAEFSKHGWEKIKVYCEYPTTFYQEGYIGRIQSGTARTRTSRPYREMDFVKNKLGIEVQFGKYAFMAYNVCAKMTIFCKLGHITHGIEIVPVKAFAEQMSTGVAYYEQFLWDLEKRGIADIDIPVMIIGIDRD